MLDTLFPDAWKWGHALSSIHPLVNGEHELMEMLANGHTAGSDVLLSADGAHSRVRPLVCARAPLPWDHRCEGLDLPLHHRTGGDKSERREG